MSTIKKVECIAMQIITYY